MNGIVRNCGILLPALLGLAMPFSGYGRGEPWVTPPPAPPAVETLTNEARYVEWKFREGVEDLLAKERKEMIV